MNNGINPVLIINLSLVVLLTFYCIRGYKKGFVIQFFGLFSIVLSAFIAWFLYLPFGKLFPITPKSTVPFQETILQSFFYEKVNSMVWYVIIFFISFIVLKILKHVLNIVFKVPGLSFINRITGVLIGLVNTVAISFLMIYALSLPIFTNGPAYIERSLLNNVVTITNVVSPYIIESLEKTQIFEAVESSEQASVEDVIKMQEYLEKNKISSPEINEFFKEINND